MIPDFKTYLKESVWGSIRKKSLGLETRIEDDVNKLDGEAFVGYIKQHYECVGTEYEPFIDVKKCITVPLFVVSNKTQFLSFNEKTDTVYLSEHSMLRDNPVYDQLHNEFSLEEKAYSCPGHFTKDDIIRPKMGYGSKKFFLEVIDFLLKNTGEPFKPVLIKKDSVNESVWGDIRKKSIGQEERIEDRVDSMCGEKLMHYLNEYYEIAKVGLTNAIFLSEGEDLVSVFVFFNNAHEPGIVDIANPGTDKSRISIPGYFIEPTQYTRVIDYNLKNMILNNYSVHSKNGGEFFEVFPKDESQITNKFFINFIDFLLVNASDKHDKVIKKI